MIVADEAIVGWRIWRLGSHRRGDGTADVFLRSCVRPGYWEPGRRFAASCATHEVPELDCECGVYAVRSREAALEWARWAREALPNPIVLGRVSLWGRVLRHTEGYRAQYAYPYELELAADVDRDELDPDDVARRLRNGYAVDVTTPARVG